MISISWTLIRSCAPLKKSLHNFWGGVGIIAQNVWITVHLDINLTRYKCTFEPTNKGNNYPTAFQLLYENDNEDAWFGNAYKHMQRQMGRIASAETVVNKYSSAAFKPSKNGLHQSDV